MRSWPDVSTGRRTRPSFWTTLQDAVDEIEGGEVSLPLAGIAGALEGYGPLTNMRELEINALDGAGVVGDGVTDCLSGLQAQLDSAANLVAAHPNIHGAKVILPPGVYGISGQLVVPSNVEFVGCGKGAFRDRVKSRNFRTADTAGGARIREHQ